MVTATAYVVPCKSALNTAVPALKAVTLAVVFVSFLTISTLGSDEVKFTICEESSADIGRINASASKESPTFIPRSAVLSEIPDAYRVTVTKRLFVTPSAITVILAVPVSFATTSFLLGSTVSTPVVSSTST